LSTLIAALGTSIANIALPTLATAFDAPFATVQGVVVAYLATLAAAVVVVGRLGDRYGLRRVHLIGLVLTLVGALAGGLAPTLPGLIAARALQGLGAACLMTLAMALMRASAGPERAGRAMGLLGTMSALGTALGPALGGLLLPLTGWRGLFLVQVPVVALTLALAYAALPPDRAAAPTQARGTLLGLPERRLAGDLTVNLLVAAVMMTTLVVGPFYLGLGLGLGATLVGLVMTVGPVVSIASGVPSGRLVDAFGAARVVRVGLALLATGSALFAILPGRIGVAGYVAALLVLTPGYQLFQAANNTAALADVAPERRGTVSGWLNLSRNLGLIAGASAMGALFAFGTGTAELQTASATAIGDGLRLTFLTATGLMLAALALATIRARR
jgi:MFS family permease